MSKSVSRPIILYSILNGDIIKQLIKLLKAEICYPYSRKAYILILKSKHSMVVET